MKYSFKNKQWCYCLHPDLGSFTGNVLKIKGRWYFRGDICKWFKYTLSEIKKCGGEVIIP